MSDKASYDKFIQILYKWKMKKPRADSRMVKKKKKGKGK